MVVCVGSANRDADAFADPERLDLRRFLIKHLSKGSGSFRSIGSRFTQWESAGFLRHFFRLVGDFAVAEPPSWHEGDATKRALKELRLKMSPPRED